MIINEINGEEVLMTMMDEFCQRCSDTIYLHATRALLASWDLVILHGDTTTELPTHSMFTGNGELIFRLGRLSTRYYISTEVNYTPLDTRELQIVWRNGESTVNLSVNLLPSTHHHSQESPNYYN